MKVALVSPPLLSTPPHHYGGLEMIVYDLGLALLDMGVEVTLIGAKGSYLDDRGTIIETIQPSNTTNVDWFNVEMESYYKYRVYLPEFDIIHEHTWFGCTYLAKEKVPELKICHTHHGHLNWNPKEIPPYIGNLNLIAISPFMKGIYENQGFKSEYVFNGIDLTKYQFENTRGDRLLFVGRISELKLPHIAIDVAEDLRMPIDIVGGTFVDNQQYVDFIRRRCRNSPFAEMHFDLEHEKKLELMQNAKAIIMPSRMMEPFGLVAVEAMACGTPVIALNDGALSSVVGTDGKAGFVCNTYGELVDAVERAESIFPIDCRKQAELFSRENMARGYYALYERLLNNGDW
jgi:glycosyltransferase involved in cell wall biosynthesis